VKTLKQWNKRGRRIEKGSKAQGWTTKGKALFKKKQTYKHIVNDNYVVYDSFQNPGTNWDQNTDECDEFSWTDPRAGR